MNILAFDTSMKACSVAVLRGREGEHGLFQAFEKRDRGHMERLMPMIEQVMGKAGLEYQELDRIAVTTGPGTFTGVRIGISSARALALAADCPLVSTTSLQVMAWSAQGQLGDAAGVSQSDHSIAIAVDARRGQIYFQLYAADASEMTEPVALTLDAAARLLPGTAIFISGSAASQLANIADQPNRAVRAVAAGLQPEAAVLVRKAKDLPLAKGPVSPLYLRPPDAKPQTDKVLPRRP